jgi:hypothetical protein
MLTQELLDYAGKLLPNFIIFNSVSVSEPLFSETVHVKAMDDTFSTKRGGMQVNLIQVAPYHQTGGKVPDLPQN